MAKKPLKYYSTKLVSEQYKDVLPELILIIAESFKTNDYDMFLIQPKDNKAELIISGYSFSTGKLKEGCVIKEINLKITETIWFKIDDYGNRYVGTFLYPTEY